MRRCGAATGQFGKTHFGDRDEFLPDDTPFFVWLNTTHMHFRTHTREEDLGRAGRRQSPYHDTMLYHDDIVGEVLDLLDELGIADDTIVMYSTDNGPHMNSWTDAGMTPFRNEKNSNWEGAYRVPCVVRWPGHIPAGTVLNGIVSHNDWFITLLAAAGNPDIADQLKAGVELDGAEYKVHLDGFNQLEYITGRAEQSARPHFFYVSDDGDLTALRFDNWKIVFLEQRATGTLRVWSEPFTELRVPKIFNLRTDPYERADITLEHVLRLADQPRIPARTRSAVRRSDAADARRVPHPPGAGIVQRREGIGEAEGRHDERMSRVVA